MNNSQANDGFSVALVQPPVWGIFDPPTALAQISSCLKAAGHKVHIFDLNIDLYHLRTEEYKNAWAIEQSSFWTNENNVRKLLDAHSGPIKDWLVNLAEANPSVIGFSANICSLHAIRGLAVMIRKEVPKALIVIGGPIFCVPFDAEHMFDRTGTDIIAYGEGEDTFRAIADTVSKGGTLDACAGIYYKEGGHIKKNEPRPPVKDLDSLPFLDLQSFPNDKYDPPGHLGKHISIMTSRGCVQNCVFCGPKAYWPGYRTMSGRRIYDEIVYQLSWYKEADGIEFLDLLINGNMKTLEEFCALMVANPPRPGLRWHSNLIIRPEMTKAVFDKMRAAGCDRVTFGIESGSQRVLGIMRKRYKITDADNVLRNAFDAGIKVTCNFMFGFPGETEEDFNETLQFLGRNAKYIKTAYPSRTYCTIEPYSYMEAHMEEFGIIPSKVHGQYWVSTDGSNTFPVRMRRCEDFSRFAMSINVDIGCGLQTSIEQDRWMNLGNYHEAINDYTEAAECYRKYLSLDPHNAEMLEKVRALELKNP